MLSGIISMRFHRVYRPLPVYKTVWVAYLNFIRFPHTHINVRWRVARTHTFQTDFSVRYRLITKRRSTRDAVDYRNDR